MKPIPIRDAKDIRWLVDFLTVAIKDRPQQVTVCELKRSVEQNSLTHKYYAEIAASREDMTVNQVRAECKMIFGVPILRANNEKFRETYDRVLKPLPYETKLEFIERTELPITSLMSVKQMSQYIDDMLKHFRERGVYLTLPEEGFAR
tara:strand:- start:1 stop:444 length:444 start_codon:yes stop_codon:yes gene_type:complete